MKSPSPTPLTIDQRFFHLLDFANFEMTNPKINSTNAVAGSNCAVALDSKSYRKNELIKPIEAPNMNRVVDDNSRLFEIALFCFFSFWIWISPLVVIALSTSLLFFDAPCSVSFEFISRIPFWLLFSKEL